MAFSFRIPSLLLIAHPCEPVNQAGFNSFVLVLVGLYLGQVKGLCCVVRCRLDTVY